MVNSLDANSEPKATTNSLCQPLVLIAAGMAFGIAMDRFIDPPIVFWLATSVLGLGAWMWFAKNHEAFGSCMLLVAITCTCSAWHHARWNWYGTNEISRYTTEDFIPIRMRGVICSEPKFKPAEHENQYDNIQTGVRTEFRVQATGVRNGAIWEPASGAATMVVQGQIREVHVGDEVEIVGKVVNARRTRNPGEFDFYHFSRSRSRLAFIAVNYPQAVTLIRKSSWPSWASPFKYLRKHFGDLVWDNIDESRAPIASAILLGDRQQMSHEQNQSFLTSGTIHILAISGLHVGILASGVYLLGQIGLLRRRKTWWIMILLVTFYALLVEGRPPVLRASILVVMFCISRLWGVKGFSLNVLASAAVVVLLLNPMELFQTGAQLSFLAVSVMSFGQRWIKKNNDDDPLDRLIESSFTPWERLVNLIKTKIRMAFVVGFLIWILALPLVASRFHLATPIAILINPVVMVPLAFSLWAGFLMLLTGWLLPPASDFFGRICDVNLWAVEASIAASRQVPFSYSWTAGPSEIAVAIFYALLILFCIYRPLSTRWLATIGISWFALAWLLPNLWISNNGNDNQMQCTFVDVGHGTSVIIQMPDGKNILYDCGTYGNPIRAQQSIARALWHEKIEHLDAVILSHADLDHYNCLPGLIERFSIGTVIVSEAMFDTRVPQLRDLNALLKKRRIPVQIVRGGDFAETGDIESKIEFLGPVQIAESESDNSRSVVVSFSYLDHSVLLAGDIEGHGLENLFAQQPRDYSVIMAAHHGSKNSHPLEFVRWSTPEWIVISGDKNKVDSSIYDQFKASNIQVLRTCEQGAIRIVIAKGNPNLPEPKSNIEAFSWLGDPIRF